MVDEQELKKKEKTRILQRKASIAWNKGWRYLNIKNDKDRALKHFEYSLVLREELGVNSDIALSLIQIAGIFLQRGELDHSIKYAERGLTLAKESNKKIPFAMSLNVMASILITKGELERSIKLYEQSLAIFKEVKNKNFMAWILNNMGGCYRMRGEFDRALEFLEQSLALFSEMRILPAIAVVHDLLIQTLIEMGDLERAQQLLRDLEQMNDQLNNKQINLTYLFDKALLLKTSPRARNRVKAEEILEQLLEDKDLNYEITIGALLNLCELLLLELRITNDAEVLNEIDPLIDRLLNIAEKSNSYWIQAEAYLLQAKLSLLTFNIKKAKRFLTQAQQIAERFGLTLLATKIANENADLFKKLDLWKALKNSGASMADRIELARLDEQIRGIVKKSSLLSTQVIEEKVAISKERKICLVCRGEVVKFSYICECGAMYCENCARALTNLENVCWSCETPIDASKPVKHYKPEQKEVEVDNKEPKNPEKS